MADRRRGAARHVRRRRAGRRVPGQGPRAVAQPAARRPLRIRGRRAAHADHRARALDGPPRPRPRRALHGRAAVGGGGRARPRPAPPVRLPVHAAPGGRATRSATTRSRSRCRRRTSRRGPPRSAPACTRTCARRAAAPTTACSRSRRASRVPVDERMLPNGPPVPVAGTPEDFTRARRVGAQRLDTCFGDLRRDPDGRARVRLTAPGGAREITVWLDAAYRFVACLHGRRRRGPRRAPRRGRHRADDVRARRVQLGDGLVVLEPGASFTGRCGLTAAALP